MSAAWTAARAALEEETASCKGGLGDGGHGHSQLEGGLSGPHPGALLAGRVDDDIDEGLTGGRIGVGQDLGGDVDEVGVELGVLPGAEDLGDLGNLNPPTWRSRS